MQRKASVEQRDGYVLTEKGRYDIECAPVCHCNPRLSGLLIECPDCGTVYGSVRENMAWGSGHSDKR